MKDDVLKFRKCVDILINEKGYNKNKISIESKLTWPTLKKILEFPIDEIKIQASVLGIIQDFIKKHSNDLNYAGIKSAPNKNTVKASERLNEVNNMKKNLSNYKTEDKPEEIKEAVVSQDNNENAEAEKRLAELTNEYFKDKEKAELLPTIEESVNPFALFIDALKLIPSNVCVKISINEK